MPSNNMRDGDVSDVWFEHQEVWRGLKRVYYFGFFPDNNALPEDGFGKCQIYRFEDNGDFLASFIDIKEAHRLSATDLRTIADKLDELNGVKT